MNKNASLTQIGQILQESESVLIFPHISPDGDALGSSIALCRALRAEGKNSYVLMEDRVPEYIGFLPSECCTRDQEVLPACDAAICVDCSEENRLGERLDVYKGAGTRLCIDHHINQEGFGDFYYINEGVAAAAELIYTLIREMGWKLDIEAAEALYTGIVTDTGSFQYSNTTPETHIIAARLIAEGVNVNKISVDLYQNVALTQAKAESRVMDRMELFAGGRAAISYITNEDLEELNATSDDTESAIDMLRNIRGVEIAAFLKERDSAVKVSLRAKTTGDVQKIARCFNGGGHKKAAGCTIKEDMDRAVELIRSAIEDVLEN
ncbi:MAG: bifunctional oligoribonuclease/PAP phosphatase NrnA [Firmicutes bacterium]|nr:bifunctional oligoribonuclease/PAP phosphatase NrnA [Bacillota bacterium]